MSRLRALEVIIMDQTKASLKTRDSAHRQASFDPVALGQRECDAWAAYYRHEWSSFLRGAIGMVSAGFGMGRRQTLTGAWFVLQANRAWAPVPNNDPDAARDYMARFYRIVRDSGWGSLDPVTAAAYEVEWWRLHRLHQRAGADVDALVDALDVLYAYVYDVPAATVRGAAALRVQAMDLSDEWVAAGCHLDDPLLVRERRALVASYTALRESVERHQLDGEGLG
jgi:hypothetical protein